MPVPANTSDIPIEVVFGEPGEPPVLRAFLPDQQIDPDDLQRLVARMDVVADEIRQQVAKREAEQAPARATFGA